MKYLLGIILVLAAAFAAADDKADTCKLALSVQAKSVDANRKLDLLIASEKGESVTAQRSIINEKPVKAATKDPVRIITTVSSVRSTVAETKAVIVRSAVKRAAPR